MKRGYPERRRTINNTICHRLKKNDFREIYSVLEENLAVFGIPARARNRKVIIKPNCCYPRSYTTGVTTDLRIIESLIRLLLDLPAEVMICESSGRGRSFSEISGKIGLHQIAVKYGVKEVDLEATPYSIVRSGSDSVRIFNLIRDAEVLLNVPVMKTHKIEGVSLSIKNLMGCIPNKEKILFHMKGIAKGLSVLSKVIKPDLNIIDGIYAMSSGGPIIGEVSRKGLLIFSDSMIAADCAGSAALGINPGDISHIVQSASANKFDMKDIKLPSELTMPGSVTSGFTGRVLDVIRWVNQFGFALVSLVTGDKVQKKIESQFERMLFPKTRPYIDSGKCSACGECTLCCPYNAVTRDASGAYGISEEKCLSCLICYEFCPSNAILSGEKKAD